MGAVYDAVHETTGRRVALKLLRAEQLRNGRAVERFLREARIVGGLSSPHIGGVLDAGTDEESGIPYLALEYLEGFDLKSLLVRRQRLPWALALAIAVQVCRGLAAAQAAGIIHRDVKPANVRLTAGSDGELVTKVMDFGVAKDIAEEISLTTTGDMVGSFSHMAPEQFSLKPIDFRADVWGVGILLFEAITGVLPVASGTSPMSLASLSLGMLAASNPRVHIPDLRSCGVTVPARVEEIVAKALSVDPAGRFASAHAMGEAMTELLRPELRVMFGDLEDGSRLTPAMPAPRVRTTRPAWRTWAGRGALVAILLAASANLVWSSSPEPRAVKREPPAAIVPEKVAPPPEPVDPLVPAVSLPASAPPAASSAPVRARARARAAAPAASAPPHVSSRDRM
ncbi:serine/threonine protein kinase [Pendulispora brunnea]|uniref:Serine/threonine protein kinase n=2 Tax=Pendulispora brunnea TaxID=2905690 RepID=A0ABZ2KFG2_9BACT